MSFTSNIQITKTYPAVLYDATESAGIWHEDHELSGARYQAANATYNETAGEWSLVNSAQPAYATVQNTDGSTGYLYMPAGSMAWLTSAWQGAGQPTAYYAVNYGMTESDATGAINTPALAAAIAAAIADPGGAGATVHIPAGTFKLNAALAISDETDKGLVIAGASGGTQLIQTSTAVAGADIFQINTWIGGTGVRFKDLYLAYPEGTGKSGNYAVNVNTGHGAAAENVTCERVYFSNCPGSFRTGNRALQCGLSDCTIDYENTISNQIAISLSGSQDFVRGCVIRQSVNNSPSGCTAIQINSVSTCYVSDTQISDFQTGVQVTEGATEVYFSNVHADAYATAVEIAPSSNTGKIYGLHFSNCNFRLVLGSTIGGSGVTIGTAGGSNSNVASIFFDNCDVIGFADAGLEIDAGQDIVVTGGQYSSNGQNPGSTAYIGAGIAILSGANISISGADCYGVSYYWQDINGGGSTQPYGITVNNLTSHVTIVGCNVTGNATNGIVVAHGLTAFPSDIFIRGCDASGYSSYSVAVNVQAGETTVEVTECAGYNDQAKVLQSSIPPPSGTFHNYSFTIPWYGPVAFYVRGAGHVTIDGTDTNLTDGGYTLSPGETASIAGTATNFLAVGK